MQYLLEYQVASTSDVRSKMSRFKVGTSHRCPEGSRCSGRAGQDSDGHEWGLRSVVQAEKGTDGSHETVKSNVSSSCRRDWVVQARKDQVGEDYDQVASRQSDTSIEAATRHPVACLVKAACRFMWSRARSGIMSANVSVGHVRTGHNLWCARVLFTQSGVKNSRAEESQGRAGLERWFLEWQGFIMMRVDGQPSCQSAAMQ